MSVSSIKRSFVGDVSIVHMIADDSYADVIASGYIASVQSSIEAVNSGS